MALVKHARLRYEARLGGPAMLTPCVVPLGCGRYCIQSAVSLLDPSSAEMALHGDADMVRAIAGARPVKFLSGPTGSQGQDAFA